TSSPGTTHGCSPTRSLPDCAPSSPSTPTRGGPKMPANVSVQRLVYLWGIAGPPEVSPALRALEADGWEIVVPSVAGFDGESGFVAPHEYLHWLTRFWDALRPNGR